MNTARLELQGNQLTGSIPVEIYNVVTLEVFYMEDNAELGREILPSIGLLVNLERFRVSRTRMGGTLPPEFFWLKSLKDFWAQEANFTGEMVPEQWLNLTALEDLVIGFNDFFGPVPNIFDQLPRLGTSNNNDCNFHLSPPLLLTRKLAPSTAVDRKTVATWK